MPVFKDALEREWKLKLDAPLIQEVRDRFEGLDLADTQGKSFERFADPVTLVNVLWVLCADQARAMNPTVSEREFGRSLVGDPIDQAEAALVQAIVDFFPGRRKALLQAIAKSSQEVNAAAIDKGLAIVGNPELIKAITTKIDADIDERIKTLTQ